MRFLLCLLFSCVIIKATGQSLELGDPPNYIPPTPEVSNKLKSDLLSVSQNSGAANFSIPLYTASSGNYSLPISINYNSAGVKVDDIASMVGMGWSLNYGGVISRTVMDLPDEYRLGGENNLTSHNFTNPDYALLDYFDNNSRDKQSDVFSFSLPGHNGRFIMDSNFVPKPLSQYNIKIQVIDTWALEGFIIITDDGTQYYFQDAETSTDRPKTGTNCKQAWGELALGEVKTSWYLTKIILPSRQREINFIYTTNTTRYKSSRNESVSLNIAREQYDCNMGYVCSINQSFYTNCVSEQFVQTKFISRIETTEGEKVEFVYDGTDREDLMGGKRLSYIKVQNYLGDAIKYIHFKGSYQQAVNGSSDYESKRLFLDSLYIRNNQDVAISQLTYYFKYKNYSGLPKRLSNAQDTYGFYNGKNTNTSLIPKLKPTDINYTAFNNGTGFASVSFGDRSIDSNYLSYGMLTGIYYPTGGRDTIVYTPNYMLESQHEILCGGLAVKKISSYTDVSQLATEKEFIYRNMEGVLSSFLPNICPMHSQQRYISVDGYTCTDEDGFITSTFCVGPACTKAIVSSSANYPVIADGNQHVYFSTVLELQKNVGNSTGLIEHKYKYYQAAGMLSEVILGSEQLGLPSNVIPGLLIGEEETNHYKMSGTSFQLVSSKIVEYENRDQSHTYNYFVRKNYQAICSNRPNGSVNIGELNAYDVARGKIYFNTPVIKNIKEKVIGDNGIINEITISMEYNTAIYSYPKVIRKTNSKGVEERIEKLYPPDFPSLNYMVARNIINPVIEGKKYYNNVLINSFKSTYTDWFSNGDIIVPQTVEVKDQNNAIRQKINYKNYDSYGNVLWLSEENGVETSYIWGYKKQHAVAQVIGKPYSTALSESGINISVVENPVTTESVMAIELNKLRNITNAQVSTFTYRPSVGLLRQTDISGRNIFNEYDGFSRLTLIKDHEGKILKKACYNYPGQTQLCDIYYNTAQSGVFTRNSCSSEYVGSAVTYTVPANTYISNESITAANTLALNDVNTNGQAYANSNGSCSIPTIYVKLVYQDLYQDIDYTTATLVLKFFSDVACTVPYSVSNLSVNYKSVRSNCGGSSPLTSNYTLNNCSGTSVVISTDEYLMLDDGIHCWEWIYSVQAGTGYSLGQ